MDSRYLASNIGGFVVLAEHYPVPFAIVVGIVVIGFVILLVRAKQSEPKWMTGTARVVSLNGSAEYRGQRWCRIELEVNIPSRERYAAVAEQNLKPAEQVAIQPGNTVTVQVDSANPQNVRIDC